VLDLPKIPAICGPTGSGKTEIALLLSEQLPVEVISADSRQILKRLNIGTAKPTEEEKRRVPFHLIDIVEPGERFSAFRFIDEANRIIGEILSRSRIPVVVGGTGLYLRALTDGVVEIEQDDMAVREQLESEMEAEGAEAMYRRLEEIDPLEAAKTHPNNKVRVIRALEIHRLTGMPKSQLITTGAYRKASYDFEHYCLLPERQGLYNAINARVDAMLAAGLVSEVETLRREGLTQPIRKSNVIGYNELLDYFDGTRTLDEAISLIKQNSRRYAKRQYTWFQHQTTCRSFGDANAALEAILADYRGIVESGTKKLD
jgi:tRNA dimethylallyltransferase